jgi:hypothetical protein
MEAVSFSKMLVPNNESTCYYQPEDEHYHHCCENLIFYTSWRNVKALQSLIKLVTILNVYSVSGINLELSYGIIYPQALTAVGVSMFAYTEFPLLNFVFILFYRIQFHM